MTLQLKDIVFNDDAATELVTVMDLILALYADTLQVPYLASHSLPGYGVQLTRLELLAILETRATNAIAELVTREVQGIGELITEFSRTKKELKERSTI